MILSKLLLLLRDPKEERCFNKFKQNDSWITNYEVMNEDVLGSVKIKMTSLLAEFRGVKDKANNPYKYEPNLTECYAIK